MELRMRAIQPDMCTLNMLMRCLSKSVTHPDEAEELMAEVGVLLGSPVSDGIQLLLAGLAKGMGCR